MTVASVTPECRPQGFVVHTKLSTCPTGEIHDTALLKIDASFNAVSSSLFVEGACEEHARVMVYACLFLLCR